MGGEAVRLPGARRATQHTAFCTTGHILGNSLLSHGFVTDQGLVVEATKFRDRVSRERRRDGSSRSAHVLLLFFCELLRTGTLGSSSLAGLDTFTRPAHVASRTARHVQTASGVTTLTSHLWQTYVINASFFLEPLPRSVKRRSSMRRGL